jgi:hypothetical protein
MAHSDKFAVSAVERGYQASPRHESLERNGVKAGRRDGKFLVEKTVEAAIIGGPAAEVALHDYFRNEQVRFSKLPGSVIVEFLRGLLEQLREYPEIGELLLGLASAAPAYSGALKINEMSNMMAEKVSTAAVNSSPAYKEQIGEIGLVACIRDNAVMLRGLSQYLMSSPGDVSSFKDWWRRRIGKNIRSKPESFDPSGPCAKANFNEVLSTLRSHLDRDEADVIESYLKQIFTIRSNGSAERNEIGPRRVMPKVAISISAPAVSFSDVGALN